MTLGLGNKITISKNIKPVYILPTIPTFTILVPIHDHKIMVTTYSSRQESGENCEICNTIVDYIINDTNVKE